jgi:hypothetical protein
MFKFKRIESNSGLEFDHRWRRAIKIGAVSVFEAVRLVAYSPEDTRLVYLRGVVLDEEYQKRLSRLGHSSTTMLMHLLTIMWLSLYVILGKIFRKESVIKNAEHDTKWHKKWPFVADQFASVKRNKKLKQLGI